MAHLMTNTKQFFGFVPKQRRELLSKDVEHQDLLQRQETTVQENVSEENDRIDFLSAIYDGISIFETIGFSIFGYSDCCSSIRYHCQIILLHI